MTLNTVVWIIPLLLLAVVKLLLPLAGPRRILTRWLMYLAENWVAGNALLLRLVSNTRWDVNGLELLRRDDWYLLIVNHQSWVDIVALQTVFNRRVPLLKFFIKKQLVWFPLLGLGFWALDMPFMQRHSKSYLAKHPEKKGSDLEATRRACQKFRHTPTSVINFIEGTRFSEEKRERRGSPYRNLLAPRAGGMALALSSMGDMFSGIVDVTVVYPSGAPDFWGMVCGELDHVVVDIQLRDVDDWMIDGDYVNDREYRRNFHQWLGGVWSDKDERIDNLRANACADN
ncbi:acyltransferase [Woeseia oceani]|uniref:Acyltransferase n=2 Tax=Woeseia oceani TaxID=1548547 RepID=A0A193LKM0_9GAMM|nr:acyltransferase [Woeseia oceani]